MVMIIINKVTENLNTFSNTKSKLTEIKLIETLKPLFLRRAFLKVRHKEEMPEYLWALRKTRSIIEYYQKEDMFKLSRKNISTVLEMMKRMEKKAIPAFSKSINAEMLFKDYQNNSSKFKRSLGSYNTMDKK